MFLREGVSEGVRGMSVNESMSVGVIRICGNMPLSEVSVWEHVCKKER